MSLNMASNPMLTTSLNEAASGRLFVHRQHLLECREHLLAWSRHVLVRSQHVLAHSQHLLVCTEHLLVCIREQRLDVQICCQDQTVARCFVVRCWPVVTAQIVLQAAMDGASFAKLCRDSGLLGGKLNTTSVDIAFSKAKAKVSCGTQGVIGHITCLLVTPSMGYYRCTPLQRYLMFTDTSCPQMCAAPLLGNYVCKQRDNHTFSRTAEAKRSPPLPMLKQSSV